MKLTHIFSLLFTVLLLIPSAAYSQYTKVVSQLFAPGIVSTSAMETSSSFTPDGKTVYFTRSDVAFSDNTIMFSTIKNGQWANPEVASFSGVWRDSEPFVARDGKRLYFVSNRPPAAGKDTLLTPRGTPGTNLWYVEKTGDGWGDPIHIEGPINAVPMVYNPSVAANGAIYFSGNLPDGGGRNQVYRSVPVNGIYGTPERLSFSDVKWNNLDPSIAPDESFIIFGSNRLANFDIFICFQKNGTWGEPVKLGDDINTTFGSNAASLGPDGHTLYFTSSRRKPITFPKTRETSKDVDKRLNSVENGNRNIWMADISQWVKGS